ncbi:MAG: GUN4 domain-containing protein [Chloroflexaceae bacterium]|nr:GUN4 domain-containing protein [Chloroflexaceae bacterium]
MDLKSAESYDYTKLRNFLTAGNWRKADEKTSRALLEVVSRQKEGWLSEEDIARFPAEDLRTINQLWLHYSQGRFGFSVQKKIYQSLGGTKDYNRDTWELISDRVGFRLEGSLAVLSGANL